MIGRLVGRLVAEDLDGTVLLDVGGVGYEVLVPVGTVARAAGEAGGALTLHVHTNVREDALELFGFASEVERKVFRLLLTVPNVGPKTALGILSALPPPELAHAVETQDLARLNKIGGVGKKTAERLALELREKLPRLGALDGRAGALGPSKGPAERLHGALTNMGYRPAEAERAVRALGERVSREPLATLLRAALEELAR